MAGYISNSGYDDFQEHMNSPEDGFDGIADIKTFPDGSRWAVCPWCGKKAVKILPETRIFKMPYKCKNSKCRKDFTVHVWDAQHNHWIKGKPDKDGYYLTRHNGTICRDEYTTSDGGYWWNNVKYGWDNDSIEYDPQSYVMSL